MTKFEMTARNALECTHDQLVELLLRHFRPSLVPTVCTDERLKVLVGQAADLTRKMARCLEPTHIITVHW